MPRVLVVDDSAVDRRFAQKVLEEDGEIEVVLANDGVEALAVLDREDVDVVLTDLVMPNLDGRALVREVRRRHPFLPVVVMTAKGSEETAVRALQEGAASYVPKMSLANSLRDTVESVLAVTGQRRGRTELMKGIVDTHCRFELDNDRRLLRPLVHFVQEMLSAFELCGEAERMRVGVAIEEALNNAAEHGNLELASAMREDDLAGYCRLASERCGEPPYSGRRIHVEVSFSRAEAVIRIRDEGTGFDPADLPDPADPAQLESTSGRGVRLMRMFMDEVVFNDVGNEVTMTKRRAAGGDGAG